MPHRLRCRDIEHALAVLEEVQPGFHEIRAQAIHDLLRKMTFLFPRGAHGPGHEAVRTRAARLAAALERLPALHDLREILLLEMLLGIKSRFEGDRLRFFGRRES